MRVCGLRLLPLAQLLVAGCGYDFDAAFEQTPFDAAADAVSDTVADTSPDGGGDAPSDAPSDRPVGPDSDAPFDVAGEAGQDAPPDVPDTGSDACPPDTKPCGGECVSTSDPGTGCAGPSCVPCNLTNAASTCDSSGACDVAVCEDGYGDCNGSAQDGCEASLLDDALNCGGCGYGCCGGSCNAGTCQTAVLSAGSANVPAIANDADAVYWLDEVGTIRRRDKGGADVETVCTVEPGDAGAFSGNDGALLVYGQSLYFGFADGAIYRVDKTATGVQPDVLLEASYEHGGIVDMTRDGSDLFFTVRSTMHIPGDAYRVNVNGSTAYSVTMLDDDPPTAIAVDPTYVYYLQYSSRTLTAKLRTAPSASNIVNFGALTDMVVDGSHLYFVDPDAKRVGRTSIPPGIGSTETLHESANTKPLRLTVDGTHVYFSDAGTIPLIGRVSKQNPTFQTVAVSMGKPRAITDDYTCVYWGTDGSGPVQAARK